MAGGVGAVTVRKVGSEGLGAGKVWDSSSICLPPLLPTCAEDLNPLLAENRQTVRGRQLRRPGSDRT